MMVSLERMTANPLVSSVSISPFISVSVLYKMIIFAIIKWHILGWKNLLVIMIRSQALGLGWRSKNFKLFMYMYFTITCKQDNYFLFLASIKQTPWAASKTNFSLFLKLFDLGKGHPEGQSNSPRVTWTTVYNLALNTSQDKMTKHEKVLDADNKTMTKVSQFKLQFFVGKTAKLKILLYNDLKMS